MSKNKFTCLNRKEKLDRASKEEYDLIVIGGGITGAGILLDAVTRGLKCLLVEKSDFASGTSSKSTKLIHGGLRYLKQFEIGLVRETGTERAIVHELAPHLVHPERMLLPIVKGGTFGKLSASMAISVYDFLANVENEDKKRSLSKKEVLIKEPLLRSDILKSGIDYAEYRTDDARLTIEIIKKAYDLGAEVFNYCKMTDFIHIDDKVKGIIVKDEVSNEMVELKSKFVVSATGPWVDLLRKKDQSLNGKFLRLTKGVHLVFDRKRIPINQSIYFDAFDGRMLFAIPRGRVTYIGTSDTDYNDDLDKVLCTKKDIEYILKAANNMLDLPILKEEDVISTWAGLRPLIQEEGKSPSELSRKDEIFESESGFISIAGGKLTGYRKMAERIVDLVLSKDKNLPQVSSKTLDVKLTSKAFKDYNQVKEQISKIENILQSKGEDPYYAFYLISNYGNASETILENAFKSQASKSSDFEKCLIDSELDYCLENESIFKPDDFFNRRTGMLYFDPKRLEEHMEGIVDYFKSKINYIEKSNGQLLKEAERHYLDVTQIES